MKKLKSILSILTIMALILINTNAIAYSGKFDIEDEIQISEYLINGKGEIDIARNVAGYKLYCQANVMDNNTYKQIKKLKDELNVIHTYNIYEASKSDDDKDEYESTQIYYKSLYGTNVEDFSDQKADEDHSIIISLLPNYTDKWEKTTDNTFNINLSSFSGTKDIVVWVQLEKMDGTRIYDAEVYEVTGTKQETQIQQIQTIIQQTTQTQQIQTIIQQTTQTQQIQAIIQQITQIQQIQTIIQQTTQTQQIQIIIQQIMQIQQIETIVQQIAQIHQVKKIIQLQRIVQQ